jgi:phosphomevalonate kinase
MRADGPARTVRRTSAPGKMFWLGEYAVLDGAPAVVAAVDRCVVCSLEAGSDDALWLEGEARTLLARSGRWNESAFGVVGDLVGAMAGAADAAGWTAPEGTLRVDSDALRGETKWGLGSSGAVAGGLAALWAPATVGEDEVVGVALAGHDAFQAGAGSGADVLTSLYGGVLRVQQRSAEPLVWTGAVRWAAIFTGQSADTRRMVAAVQAWGAEAPAEWAALRSQLVACATRGADALRVGDEGAFVDAVAEYGALETELTGRSGVPVVSEGVGDAMRRAAAAGWVAKPSGAGGGDVVIAFAREGADADERLDAALRGSALVRLPLGLAGRGALASRAVGGG